MTTRDEFVELVHALKSGARMDERAELSDYADDIDMANERRPAVVAVYNAQAARIAELEAALHSLVDVRDDEEPGIYDWYYCAHGCLPVTDAEGRERHAPDCPVSLARVVLEHKEA